MPLIRKHIGRITDLTIVLFSAITETEEEKKSYAEQNTPYFVIRLTDTEIMEKTFLRFMVKVIGEPRPQIELLVSSYVLLFAHSPKINYHKYTIN